MATYSELQETLEQLENKKVILEQVLDDLYRRSYQSGDSIINNVIDDILVNILGPLNESIAKISNTEVKSYVEPSETKPEPKQRPPRRKLKKPGH